MTRTPLRLLLVEDSDDDALLVSTALESHGYDLGSKQVMTADEFRAALVDDGIQMILCDYAMPSFDAFEALEILRESGMDIPLIIVSGTIRETEAVRAMTLGAADHLLKDNLIRLGSAVERELREADIRRQKRMADAVVRANELRYLTQRNALIALTRETQPEILQTEDAFRRITETTARTLGVDRVSIWRFTEDRKDIECLDLYELAPDRHSAGLTLIAFDYPSYFESLETMELIAADNAASDPSTGELSDAYLMRFGISSMMDIPVRLGKRVNHILCCEHTGAMRH